MPEPKEGLLARQRLITAPVGRQEAAMDAYVRESWTEDEVQQSLGGEHDYLEWKSGKLLDSVDEVQSTLAKGLAAFANSGGGHIILGVANDGTFDGLPTTFGKSRTSTREWLEQKIPTLVSYPLTKFRVHIVQKSQDSTIPSGLDIMSATARSRRTNARMVANDVCTGIVKVADLSQHHISISNCYETDLRGRRSMGRLGVSERLPLCMCMSTGMHTYSWRDWNSSYATLAESLPTGWNCCSAA